MADLLKLAERVEAGLTASEVSVEIAEALGNPEDNYKYVFDAVAHGSLDAAKALHEQLLPGWDWELLTHEGMAHSGVWQQGQRYQTEFTGESTTPAAAWVAAILRAKNSSAAE